MNKSLVASDKKIIALCYRYSPNALAGEIINQIKKKKKKKKKKRKEEKKEEG